MPDKVKEMNAQLTEELTEMKASYPLYNPNFSGELPKKEFAPEVKLHKIKDGVVKVVYETHGAKVTQANLIYSTYGKDAGYQEWFASPMNIKESGPSVNASLPEGTKYFFVNLIDENNFLVSYPEVGTIVDRVKKSSYSDKAIKVQ